MVSVTAVVVALPLLRNLDARVLDVALSPASAASLLLVLRVGSAASRMAGPFASLSAGLGSPSSAEPLALLASQRDGPSASSAVHVQIASLEASLVAVPATPAAAAPKAGSAMAESSRVPVELQSLAMVQEVGFAADLVAAAAPVDGPASGPAVARMFAPETGSAAVPKAKPAAGRVVGIVTGRANHSVTLMAATVAAWSTAGSEASMVNS